MRPLILCLALALGACAGTASQLPEDFDPTYEF